MIDYVWKVFAEYVKAHNRGIYTGRELGIVFAEAMKIIDEIVWNEFDDYVLEKYTEGYIRWIFWKALL